MSAFDAKRVLVSLSSGDYANVELGSMISQIFAQKLQSSILRNNRAAVPDFRQFCVGRRRQILP